MSRLFKPLLICLDAKAANGVGATLNVLGYSNILVELSFPAASTATVKAVGSVSETAPNFAAAQSVSNHYSYIESSDYNNTATPIIGTTGVSVTASADTRILELNTNALRWVNFIVSGYTAGSVTVKVLAVEQD